MLAECWAALGGAPDAVRSLEVTDGGPWFGGPLDVDGLALGACGSVLLAAAELASARGLGRPSASVSAAHLAVSVVSERHARVRGKPSGAGFAPLSRMLRRAGGGWARTSPASPIRNSRPAPGARAAARRRASSMTISELSTPESARARLLGDPDEQLSWAAADIEHAVGRPDLQARDRLVDQRRVERVVERPVAVGDRGDPVAVDGGGTVASRPMASVLGIALPDGVDWGVCVRDAATGDVLAAAGADRVLPAASIGKVFLLIETARSLDLDEPLTRTREDAVADTLPAGDLAALAHVRADRGMRLHHKTGTDTGVRADAGLLEGPAQTLAYAVLARFDDARRDEVLGVMRALGAAMRSTAAPR
jgi:hypothetical protein